MEQLEREAQVDTSSLSAEQVLEPLCLFSLKAGRVLEQLSGFVLGKKGVYAEIGRAYCYNVEALFTVVSMPFAIARQSVAMQEYQRLSMANELQLVLDSDIVMPQEEVRTRAAENSMQEMKARYASSDGKQKLLAQSKNFLHGVLNEELRAAAQNLLRQGLVLAWSAFEVAARDTFIAYLNEHPAACQRLLRDPTARRRLDISKVPLETLLAHGFDLSHKMGTLLSSYQDLSDLISIKTVLSALFGSAALSQGFAAESLWILSQERHLIVHRCGVVDQEFRTNSNSQQKVGERLRVTPADLLKRIAAATEACLAMLEAASRTGDGSDDGLGEGGRIDQQS